ncbi:MAG: DUF4037 domain-containing protein [Bifidobacteriaceae bacterium]|jgi:tetratricopeptide (TPR) repeat protein|nr:DUF4037 domain-containing protein [Bifidobacteriaceae bacterium]
MATNGEPDTADAQSPSNAFDVREFLAHLDDLFASKTASPRVEAFLNDALARTRTLGDHGAELTVLNEIMGFYRSQSQHAKGIDATQQALDLVRAMGIEGSEAATTTLINAATEYRAAGSYETALQLYQEALDASTGSDASHPLDPHDRKLAALHNNLSIAYSDLDRFDDAQKELDTALSILIAASPDPSTDIDVGSTHANLALVCTRSGQEDEAAAHADAALKIFSSGHHEDASHFSSALAAAGETFFLAGRYTESIAVYERALDLITRSYGTDNDYYKITAENLAAVRHAKQQTVENSFTPNDPDTTEDNGIPTSDAIPASAPASTTRPGITGLELARRFWEECGLPMITEKYSSVRGRIAAGLVGHGSECYGFDDAFSRDHDFAPRFCLWLTPEDYEDFGEQLQRDYDALPGEFMGFGRAGGHGPQRTPRSQGSNKRDGVFTIPGFYESITGFTEAPGDTGPEAVQWLIADEASFAAATNGAIFADPMGEFSRIRAGFKAMPDDVRLSLISRRLGMLSQAGQYNFPRMIARSSLDGDAGARAAAWRSLNEFAHSAASLVFLVNSPSAAGYLPYYKWEMAALVRLSSRMATRLADVAGLLEHIMMLSSQACFADSSNTSATVSTRDIGGYDAPHSPAADAIYEDITRICDLVVRDLRAENLTTSSETFLEWQRPYVEETITNQQLKSL